MARGWCCAPTAPTVGNTTNTHGRRRTTSRTASVGRRPDAERGRAARAGRGRPRPLLARDGPDGSARSGPEATRLAGGANPANAVRAAAAGRRGVQPDGLARLRGHVRQLRARGPGGDAPRGLRRAGAVMTAEPIA